MTAWPASLPLLRVGLSDEFEYDVLVTGMDAGPPKFRRRFSVDTRYMDAELELDGTQRATLETFYSTTLQGIGEFDLQDPADGATQSWRFASRPRFRLHVGHDTATKRRWTATFRLVQA